MVKDGILTSSGKNTGLLRMTEWGDEIITSSGKKTPDSLE